MLSQSAKIVLSLIVAIGLLCGYAGANAQTQDLSPRFSASKAAQPLVTAIVYNQPPNASGALYQSSWWDPDGSDYDQYVWDGFMLPTTLEITEVQWRGGYDPTKFASGGPVIEFTVAIYASLAGGSQPDVGNPPLVRYHTGGSAGEIPVGTVGSTAMYDYLFALPTPFQAVAGTKYWVQIEAVQHGIPDWGIAAGTLGDGMRFRRTANAGDAFYQLVAGDAAFTLLGPLAAVTDTPTPTVTQSATPTVTSTDTMTATPTATGTDTPIPTATLTATPTVTSTDTPTPTATPSATPAATATDTPTPTMTTTPTAMPSVTPAATATDTPTPTMTTTPTAMPSVTPTATSMPTSTATRSVSPTATQSVPTATATPGVTPTPTSVAFQLVLPLVWR